MNYKHVFNSHDVEKKKKLFYTFKMLIRMYGLRLSCTFAGIRAVFPLTLWVHQESTKSKTNMEFTVWLLAGMITVFSSYLTL